MGNNNFEVLTAAEISNLWTQFMNDSMSKCVISYFLEHVEDTEIKDVLEVSLRIATNHLEKIAEFLKQGNFPIPKGFTSEDVNVNAPRLFSDRFMIIYMHVMTLHGLTGYAGAIETSAREKFSSYFIECNKETMDLYSRVMKVMRSKNLVSRTPTIEPPEKIDFVKKQSYLTGWFGKKRPLNGVEITGLSFNMQKTVVKAVLELGFSQVAQSKDIQDYFKRGALLCNQQFDTMKSFLDENQLPAPQKWYREVLNSNEPPFSEKLMIYHIVSLISASMGFYGAGLSVSMRRDLAMKYMGLIAEIGLYAEDGANILINRGWLEQSPMIK